jgi:hypothetical protein
MPHTSPEPSENLNTANQSARLLVELHNQNLNQLGHDVWRSSANSQTLWALQVPVRGSYDGGSPNPNLTLRRITSFSTGGGRLCRICQNSYCNRVVQGAVKRIVPPGANKDLFLASLVFYPGCSSDLWSNRRRRPRKLSQKLRTE